MVDALAQSKTMVTNYSRCHWAIHSLPSIQIQNRKKKVPVLFKNVPEEAIIIYFIKSQPLRTPFFVTQWEYMEVTNATYWNMNCLKEKHLWGADWTSRFLNETLYLHRRITDRQTVVLQICIFGRHLLENEPSVSATSIKRPGSICCE